MEEILNILIERLFNTSYGTNYMFLPVVFGAIKTFAATGLGKSVLGAAATGVSSLFGNRGAKKAQEAQERAAEQARKDKLRLQNDLKLLEGKRQAIINPYENVTDLSGMIENTDQYLSNPFANLGVATQAAEFQAEEADVALANTLDILQATGASAGGATALAQAALQSKRSVSANIEQQEVRNQEMAARGEANLQQQKQAEAIRVQAAKYGEAARMQDIDVAGREFVFGQQERREGEQLNRLQSQITNQAQAAQAYGTNAANIGMARSSAVGNIVGQGLTTLGDIYSNYQSQKKLGAYKDLNVGESSPDTTGQYVPNETRLLSIQELLKRNPSKP
tara:strand:+ start:5893 stop:6900 length:1008 start_codon:yes stop_codon:yes gene_type:complete